MPKGRSRQRLKATDRQRQTPPLDVMIANMNWAERRAQECAKAEDEKGEAEFREIAQQAAKDAAPYVHARLQTVQMNHSADENYLAWLEAVMGETRGLPAEQDKANGNGRAVH